MVDCPKCGKPVKEKDIDDYIDSSYQILIIDLNETAQKPTNLSSNVLSFFYTLAANRAISPSVKNLASSPLTLARPPIQYARFTDKPSAGTKQFYDDVTNATIIQK